MPRPINQTAADRRREDYAVSLFANALRKKWGALTVWRCDPLYLSACDAIIQRKERLLFVEVKCRTCSVHDYNTYLISAAKMEKLQEISSVHTCALVVKWRDALGVYYVKGNDIPDDVTKSLGGRDDRNQDGDIEMCWHIPITSFQILD